MVHHHPGSVLRHHGASAVNAELGKQKLQKLIKLKV